MYAVVSISRQWVTDVLYLPPISDVGLVIWGGIVGWDVGWVFGVGAAFTGTSASSSDFVKGFPPCATYCSTSPFNSLPLGPVAGMSLGFKWYVSRSTLTAGDIRTEESGSPAEWLVSSEVSCGLLCVPMRKERDLADLILHTNVAYSI